MNKKSNVKSIAAAVLVVILLAVTLLSCSDLQKEKVDPFHYPDQLYDLPGKFDL